MRSVARLLLFVMFAECVAPLIPTGHAATPLPGSCNPALLSQRDVYNLFGRTHASTAQIRELFQLAKTDPNLRAHLNAKIADNSELSRLAESGLRFKKELTAMASQVLFYPKRDIHNRFLVFKNSLLDKQDRPLTEQQAELRARSDTASRFGIDTNFSESSLPYHVKHYYSRQRNRYLLQDEPRNAPSPRDELARYRAWLLKTAQTYENLRTENWRKILECISKFEKKPIRFKGLALGLGAAEWSSVKMKVTSGPSIATPLKIKNQFRWAASGMQAMRRHFGFYRANLVFERPPVLPSNASLHFEGPSATPGPYALAVGDLTKTVEDYIDRLGKTNLDDANEVANELLVRLYFEYDLAELVTSVEAEGEKPNMIRFEQVLKTAANLETEEDTESTRGSRLLTRLRALQTPMADDALTGVEWFGYGSNADYWGKRDETQKLKKIAAPAPSPTPTTDLTQFKTKESLSKTARRSFINDFFKATEIGKVIRGAAYAGIAVAGFFWGLNQVMEFTGTPNGLLFRGSGDGTEQSQGPKRSGQEGDGEDASTISIEPEDGDPKAGTGSAPQIAYSIQTGSDTEHFLAQRKKYADLPSDTLAVPDRFWVPGPRELEDEDALIEVPYIGRDTLASSDTTTFRMVRIWSELPITANNGFIELPVPPGYAIYSINVHEKLTGPLEVTLLRHARTGNYLIKIPEESNPEGLDLYATFYADPNAKPEHHSLDPRFVDLDRTRLAPIIEDIREAGLIQLADALTLNWEDPLHLNFATDVARTILLSSRYSIEKPNPLALGDWLSPNPFTKFRRYLHDGSLRLSNNSANDLLETILKQYYRDDPMVVVEPNYSRAVSPPEMAILTGEHRETSLNLGNPESRILLDPTPIRLPTGDEKVAPIQHRQKAQHRKDRREANEAEKKRREHDRKYGARPNFDLYIERRPKLEILSEDAPPEELEQALSHHELMIQKVVSLREALLKNSAFKTQVKTGQVFPSVHVFRLAKTVLNYANGEIDERALAEALGQESLKESREKAETQWKTLSDHYIKLERMRRDDALLYTWTQSEELRVLTFELYKVLESYDWEKPRSVQPSPEQ